MKFPARARRSLGYALAVGAMAISSACSGAVNSADGSGRAVTLKFTSSYGPGSFFGDSQERWMKDIEESSDGSIKFERFWSGSLVGAADSLSAISQGRADVGFTQQPYFPVELPLTNASYLPQFTTDAEAIVKAYADVFASNEAFQAEWDKQNARPIAWVPVAPMGLGSKSPIETVADFKGKTVRSSGPQSLAYQLMGAGTAAIASEETYEGLQRGVVDAWAGLTIDGTAAMGFAEVAPHLLAFPEFYSSISSPITINLDVWNRLSDEQRATIAKAGTNYQDYSVKMAMDYEAKGCQKYLDAGGSVSELSQAERDEWMSKVEAGMTKSYYDSSQKSGIPRPELESFADELFDAATKNSETSSYEDGFVACAKTQANS